MMVFLWVALVAAGVTAVMSIVMLRLSKRFSVLPAIRERDVHENPTPRLGGVAMFAGVVVAMLTAVVLPGLTEAFSSSNEMWAILFASLLVATVGVVDDIYDIDWMVKLGTQLLAAGIIAVGGAQILSVPFGDTLVVASPGLNFVATVLLITLVMNAVNFIDGLDGLVAGVAIIANVFFFVYTQLLAQQTGENSSILIAALIAAVIVGVSAGFLPFNWHRAKMFMGDTGSLLIGLLMAASTITVTGQLNPAQLDQKLVLASFIPILLPIAVLIMPLADFSLAVFRRLRAGQSPFAADRKHLHHRLLDMGHSPVQAVSIFYLWTVTVSLALLLVFVTQSYTWPLVVAGIGGLMSLIVTLTPLVWVRDWLAQRGLLRMRVTHSQHNTPSQKGATHE